MPAAGHAWSSLCSQCSIAAPGAATIKRGEGITEVLGSPGDV